MSIAIIVEVSVLYNKLMACVCVVCGFITYAKSKTSVT